MSNGSNAEIDLTRERLENPDGSVSTELSITIESDGEHINIPTIVQGRRRTPEEAIELWEAGINRETGRFASLEEAEQAAQDRSRRIGEILEGGEPTPQPPPPPSSSLALPTAGAAPAPGAAGAPAAEPMSGAAVDAANYMAWLRATGRLSEPGPPRPGAKPKAPPAAKPTMTWADRREQPDYQRGSIETRQKIQDAWYAEWEAWGDAHYKKKADQRAFKDSLYKNVPRERLADRSMRDVWNDNISELIQGSVGVGRGLGFVAETLFGMKPEQDPNSLLYVFTEEGAAKAKESTAQVLQSQRSKELAKIKAEREKEAEDKGWYDAAGVTAKFYKDYPEEIWFRGMGTVPLIAELAATGGAGKMLAVAAVGKRVAAGTMTVAQATKHIDRARKVSTGLPYGTSFSADVYDGQLRDLRAIPAARWQTDPIYQEARAANPGKSHEEIVDFVARDRAFWPAVILGVAAGTVGPMLGVDKAIVGPASKTLRDYLSKSIGATAAAAKVPGAKAAGAALRVAAVPLGEGAEEIAEGVAQAMAENRAVGMTAPELAKESKIGHAIAEGAIVGVGVGAVGGAVQARREFQEAGLPGAGPAPGAPPGTPPGAAPGAAPGGPGAPPGPPGGPGAAPAPGVPPAGPGAPGAPAAAAAPAATAAERFLQATAKVGDEAFHAGLKQRIEALPAGATEVQQEAALSSYIDEILGVPPAGAPGPPPGGPPGGPQGAAAPPAPRDMRIRTEEFPEGRADLDFTAPDAIPPTPAQVAPTAPIPAQTAPEAPTEPAAFRLSEPFRRIKPRYGYKDRNFEVAFDNDFDRATYTLSQSVKNKRHDEILNELLDTGYTEAQLIEHGKRVRARLKEWAQGKPEGDDAIRLPAVAPAQRLTTEARDRAEAAEADRKAERSQQATDRFKKDQIVDPAKDSLFTAIAKLGGLNRDSVVGEWGVDLDKPFKSKSLLPVVRAKAGGGLTIDGMGEALAPFGYIELDENGKHDLRDFEEKFDLESRGQLQYTPLGEEALAREAGDAEAQARQRAEDAEADARAAMVQEAELTPEELESTGYFDLNSDEQRAVEALVAALRGRNIPEGTLEGILERAAVQAEGDPDPVAYRRAIIDQLREAIRAPATEQPPPGEREPDRGGREEVAEAPRAAPEREAAPRAAAEGAVEPPLTEPKAGDRAFKRSDPTVRGTITWIETLPEGSRIAEIRMVSGARVNVNMNDLEPIDRTKLRWRKGEAAPRAAAPGAQVAPLPGLQLTEEERAREDLFARHEESQRREMEDRRALDQATEAVFRARMSAQGGPRPPRPLTPAEEEGLRRDEERAMQPPEPEGPPIEEPAPLLRGRATEFPAPGAAELPANVEAAQRAIAAGQMHSHRDSTPDDPLLFASGLSRTSDFKPALEAGVNVGVEVNELSQVAIDQLGGALAKSAANLFVDSGAFSIFRANLREGARTDQLTMEEFGSGGKALNFDQIMDRYDRIAGSVAKGDEAFGDGSGETNARVFYVMPDIVGDQAGSIELARQYADEIRAFPNTIVPLQVGALSLSEAYRQVLNNVGVMGGIIVGIPSNEKAAPMDQVVELLQNNDVAGVHFLGAVSQAKLRPKLAAIKKAGWDGPTSADANVLRSNLYAGTRAEALRAAIGKVGAQVALSAGDRARRRRAAELTAEARANGGVLLGRQGGTDAEPRRLLLTARLDDSGGYRVTSFLGAEPVGHREYDSLEEAVAEFMPENTELEPLPEGDRPNDERMRAMREAKAEAEAELERRAKLTPPAKRNAKKRKDISDGIAQATENARSEADRKPRRPRARKAAAPGGPAPERAGVELPPETPEGGGAVEQRPTRGVKRPARKRGREGGEKSSQLIGPQFQANLDALEHFTSEPTEDEKRHRASANRAEAADTGYIAQQRADYKKKAVEFARLMREIRSQQTLVEAQAAAADAMPPGPERKAAREAAVQRALAMRGDIAQASALRREMSEIGGNIEVARYVRDRPHFKPATLESVRAAIATALGVKPEQLGTGRIPGVHVISESEIFDGDKVIIRQPGKEPAVITRIGATEAAFYDPRSNLIVMIAERTPAGREIGTFWHELGHKRGEQFIGREALDRLRRELMSWYKEPAGSEKRELADRIAEKVRNSVAGRDRTDAAGRFDIEATTMEELFPYAMSEIQNAGYTPTEKPGLLRTPGAFLGRVYRAIRDGIRRLFGLPPGVMPRLTPSDVLALGVGLAHLEAGAAAYEAMAKGKLPLDLRPLPSELRAAEALERVPMFKEAAARLRRGERDFVPELAFAEERMRGFRFAQTELGQRPYARFKKEELAEAASASPPVGPAAPEFSPIIFKQPRKQVAIRTREDLRDFAANGRRPEVAAIPTMKEWLIENITDNQRPFLRWLREHNLGRRAWEQLKLTTGRLRNQAEIYNREILEPLSKDIATFAKNAGVAYEQAALVTGWWATLRHVPEANAALRDKLITRIAAGDRAAVTELRRFMETQAGLHPNLGDPNRGSMAAGITDAEAARYTQQIEQPYTPQQRQEISAIADKIVGAFARLKQDALASGQISPQAAAQFPNFRHYVAMTGDNSPIWDAAEASDAFGSYIAENRLRSREGRGGDTVSESALEALAERIGRVASYTASVPFKRELNDIYNRAGGPNNTIGLERIAANLVQHPHHSDIVWTAPNGTRYIYRFSQSSSIGEALLGQNREETNGIIMKGIDAVTRRFSRAVTQWVMLFGPINAFRDIYEKAKLIRSRGVEDQHGNVVSVNRLWALTWKNSMNPETWRTTYQLAFSPNKQASNATQIGRWSNELVADGGLSTWGEQTRKGLETIREGVEKEAALAGYGSVREKWWENTKEFIARWNLMWELNSSLSVNAAMRELGVERQRASAETLDLMNFANVGAKTKWARAMYAFFNPAVQSGYNLAKQLSTKRGQRDLLITLTVMGFIQGVMRLLGDDDPELGDKLDQVGTWELDRNLPVRLLGVDLKLPIGFGMGQLAWGLTNAFSRWLSGRYSAPDAVAQAAVAALKTVNPIPISEVPPTKQPVNFLVKTFFPTAGRPLIDMVSDTDAWGTKLTTYYPDKSKLRAEQGRPGTPKLYKDWARELAKVGFDVYPEHLRSIKEMFALGPVGYAMDSWADSNKEAEGRRLNPIDKIPGSPLLRVTGLSRFVGGGSRYLEARYYEKMDTLFNEKRLYNQAKGVGRGDQWAREHPDAMRRIDSMAAHEAEMRTLSKEFNQLMRDLQSDKVNFATARTSFERVQNERERAMREFLRKTKDPNWNVDRVQ